MKKFISSAIILIMVMGIFGLYAISETTNPNITIKNVAKENKIEATAINKMSNEIVKPANAEMIKITFETR